MFPTSVVSMIKPSYSISNNKSYDYSLAPSSMRREIEAMGLIRRHKHFDTLGHFEHDSEVRAELGVSSGDIHNDTISLFEHAERFVLKRGVIILDKSRVKDITWIYYLGHAGIRDKEIADSSAVKAAARGTVMMKDRVEACSDRYLCVLFGYFGCCFW